MEHISAQIIESDDGSNTLIHPILGDCYHSLRGAVGEAMHVYINAGLNHIEQHAINIFEVGFGSGLNAMLTLLEAQKSHRKIHYTTVELYPLTMECVEKLNYFNDNPQHRELFMNLHNAEWNKDQIITGDFTICKVDKSLIDITRGGSEVSAACGVREGVAGGSGGFGGVAGVSEIHGANGGVAGISDVSDIFGGTAGTVGSNSYMNVGGIAGGAVVASTAGVWGEIASTAVGSGEAREVNKCINGVGEIHGANGGVNGVGEIQEVREVSNNSFDKKFDLVYFDAFAPDTQSELWSKEVFQWIFQTMNNNGILVTYTAKGVVKENLRSAGFLVTRLVGALGKRHMVRAVKNTDNQQTESQNHD